MQIGFMRIRSTSISARITDQHRAAVFANLEASPWIAFPDEAPDRSGITRKEGTT